MAIINRKLGKYLLVGFYTFAGINHFINPEFYLPLIPPYFRFTYEINYMAGIFEILFAVGLLIPYTRYVAALSIIMMLLAFIPSHIYFIQQGSCIEPSLCVPDWVGWARLVVIHPFLILWAWYYRK